MSDTTRPIGTRLGTDGVPVASTTTSPVQNQQRARCAAPPSTVVPVVFIPGIMGSNLRDKTTKESTWNCNSSFSLALQWIFRWPSTRQKYLDPSKNEVDPSGVFVGASATVPDKDTAIARGWDTCSKAFYGEFLRWLDDQLNAGAGDASQSQNTPWREMVGDTDLGKKWNAKKSFEPITEEEAKNAWNDFYCPVHAVGYNWLKSNGEGGKDVAAAIDKIIKFWDDQEHDGCKTYDCTQVILVTHSMGGLTARAAVHSKFGNAKKQVLGIVHGEQPANGAAAAYHHCRSGYDGLPGMVLGRNAAQVTAVFANAPGAMELLPNQQYYVQNKEKGWLRASTAGQDAKPLIELPEQDPYIEIYNEQSRWWRLVDPTLIDPANQYGKTTASAWAAYGAKMTSVSTFHHELGTTYHSSTFIHYGADAKTYPAYGELVWGSVDSHFFGLTHSASESIDIKKGDLADSVVASGSNPVTAREKVSGKQAEFKIVEPGKVRVPQPGDGTVPACSGEAPVTQGGSAVKQGFCLTGFEHSGAYNDLNVRDVTLYAICKILRNTE